MSITSRLPDPKILRRDHGTTLNLLLESIARCIEGKLIPDDPVWFLPQGERIATMDWKTLSNGAVIAPFSVVMGPAIIYPGANLGPQVYIRPGCIIGERCRVGHAVELVASIVGAECSIAHRSYIGYSFLGAGTMIGAGFSTAVRNWNDSPIRVRDFTTKETLLQTKLPKLGLIAEENNWVGCHVVSMPGTFLRRGARVLPFNSIGGSVGRRY